MSLSLLFLTFVTIQLERDYYRQELEGQAEILLETIPYTIRDPLYFLEQDELLDVTGKIGENTNISRFVIYGPAGVILADSLVDAPVFSTEADPLGKILSNMGAEDSYILWQEGQFISGRPIFLENQRLGAVSVNMSTEALDKKINELVEKSFLITALIMLAGTILSFIFAQQITNPLRILTEATREMAAGNMRVRVDVRSSSEIGQLGEAFNYMIEAIEVRERDLRQLTLSLEQIVEERTEELQHQNKELQKMAISDHLTKINNRRHFFELAEKEFKRAGRYGHHLSLVLADIDHFKEVNDAFGHLVGDRVLTDIAHFLEKNIRNIDVVARYGGEEFVILMPEITCEEASIMSERLRQGVEDLDLIGINRDIDLTLSIGVCCWDGKENINFETLLFRADQAMYRSKDKGRNCVSVW